MEITVPATAGHEPAVTYTIGVEPGKQAGEIAIVHRARDTATVLEAYRLDDYAHPFALLAETFDDICMYWFDAWSDPDEPEPTLLPLAPDVLAALGQPLYTGLLSLRADQLAVPASGPRWQILDHSGVAWRDLETIVDCESPGCEVAADHDSCVVLVSQAYAAGYVHKPADALVSVRIPASAS